MGNLDNMAFTAFVEPLAARRPALAMRPVAARLPATGPDHRAAFTACMEFAMAGFAAAAALLLLAAVLRLLPGFWPAPAAITLDAISALAALAMLGATIKGLFHLALLPPRRR